MTRTPTVTVTVDLKRIRTNAEAVIARTGVPLIAVVKADAYGLGAREVAVILADLVDAFYVFDAAEVVTHELYTLTGKRSITLLGESNDSADYLRYRIHPAVWSIERAKTLATAHPVLAVDTGQQRFGCPMSMVPEILAAADLQEAFTHAVTIEQVAMFDGVTAGRIRFRHAAGSALLASPAAYLDAVRPGLALYERAARVSTRLIEIHQTHGPAGYSGFTAAHHGIIRCGYSNGLRPGPCVINGIRRQIREVGMQTAFVEIAASDRVGDEVVLLGDGVTEIDVARAWNCTPQEVLVRLAGAGIRNHAATKVR